MRSKSWMVLLPLMAFAILWPVESGAQNLGFAGQFSAIHVSKIADPYEMQNGIRYIPEIKAKYQFKNGFGLDGELSANTFLSGSFLAPDSLGWDADLKLYRMWGRISHNRFEMRLGLQKINFGSASIFRPLMWFDRLDPRDPLQLTNGVYGMLMRYYFKNNANIWLWGLIGNDELKGWETIRSAVDFPEMGLRLQTPLGRGEIALTGHYRKIDPSEAQIPFNLNPVTPEYRVGIDGKWDIGPGIWFEGTWIWTDLEPAVINHVRSLAVGSDYTWNLGNGLNTMAEHYINSSSAVADDPGTVSQLTAVMLRYPLNVIHNLSGMVFFSWKEESWYRLISWQMQFDKLSLNLIGFWNPDSGDVFRPTGKTNLFAGKGFQIVFVINH